MEKDFLEQWTYRQERAQVALLSAPSTFPPVPSIALSIFQSALHDAGISSKVIYASFPMLHLMGVETFQKILGYIDLQKNAEYLFAHLTDVSASVSVAEFVKTFTSPRLPEERRRELEEMVARGCRAAEEIVEAAAQRIIRMGARIVAASSIYSQQNGSLAILKRVKELDPSVYTILGGHNVSGEMGMTILRHFPSVDYVSFGEGDETIAQVCSNLLNGLLEPMPYGTVGRQDPLPSDIPFRMTKDMNSVAFPNYRDFYEESRMEAGGFYGDIPAYQAQTYEQTFFLEGSRGCWWGAKHSCTFCGLNGLNHTYREKSPRKLYEEIRKMKELYPEMNIQLSDNVLSGNMIRELLPLLTEDPEHYTILAEIKTNLGPEEIKALSDAGINFTQPGIESLNDHLLKIMNKGCSAIQNIALMKYCMTYRVFPVWNMMVQVPGENREDYEQMLQLIPLLAHLNPPSRANPIMFMRFSRYTDHPQEYGLQLKPDPLYRCCFSNHPDIEENFGNYYQLAGGAFVDTIRENQDLYALIYQAVYEWRKLYFSGNRPRLMMADAIFGIAIHDSRPCAPEKSRILFGPGAKLYRLAWKPVSFDFLAKQLPECSEEDVKSTLDDLIRDKLMIFLGGKYLALAVPVQAE